MRKWVCCELPPPPECPKHSERHKHPAHPIPPELTERPALQKQDEKNSYLEEKFLAQTKTVLRVQLVIAVLICLVLSFIFSIFLSGRLSDEKLQKARLELLANISHDLRTPLTLIKGYAENIAEFSWQKEERYKHDVGIIVRETDRLSNLVNDILEYSCVHGDNGTAFKNENFDLAQLAKECAVQFGSQVECDIDYADNSNTTYSTQILQNALPS